MLSLWFQSQCNDDNAAALDIINTVCSMPYNLVSAVSRHLTPEVVVNIASASSLDGSGTQRAVKAAVPAILSALVNVAETPPGARRLTRAAADQTKGFLKGLTNQRLRSEQAASQGGALLASLLGASASSKLASALCQFVGVGPRSMQFVVGLVTLVILSVLRGQQRGANPGTKGVARLLAGQKDQIVRAMPTGLFDALAKDGVYEGIASTATPELRITYDTSRTAYDQPSKRRIVDEIGSADWPYWALGVLLFGGLLWSLLPSAHQAVERVNTAQSSSEPWRIASGAEHQPIDLGSTLDNWVSMAQSPNAYIGQELYSRTGEGLGTIKDVLIRPDGKKAAAVISVGRYLGIGDKDVAVLFSTLHLEPGANSHRIVINTSKDALQAASALERPQATKR